MRVNMNNELKYVNITTPIYYASGEPHLGHAYTSILADTFKRFYNLLGDYEARLETGTDEHGLKIERLANKKGITPNELVDDLAKRFAKAWEKLEINYDDFIRTTEKRHIEFAQSFWNKLVQCGDIYLGKYEGMYCVDCEQYYSESELVDGEICPVHHKKVEYMKEESYFFRLSKYHDWLYDYIEKHEDFILPLSRRNEVLGFLRTERLKDFSISRTSFKWGIEVPNNPNHIMYVWIDALTNYISSLGGWESENFDKYWKHTIHFLGKDILRFHAIYWPCMLKAAGLPLPRNVIAHGWWTISDRKISKSDPATKVNPVQIAEDISVDGLRLYLIKETSLDRDGNLDYHHLIEVVNTYLANKIGNLVNRTVSMVNKYLQGESIPLEKKGHYIFLDSEILEKEALAMKKHVIEDMKAFEPANALNEIIKYVDLLNGYIDKTMPWKLAKENDASRMNELFAVLLEGIRWMTACLYIFLPDISQVIDNQFGFRNSRLPNKFRLDYKRVTNKPEIVFKRIDPEREKVLIEKWTNREKM